MSMSSPKTGKTASKTATRASAKSGAKSGTKRGGKGSPAAAGRSEAKKTERCRRAGGSKAA